MAKGETVVGSLNDDLRPSELRGVQWNAGRRVDHTDDGRGSAQAICAVLLRNKGGAENLLSAGGIGNHRVHLSSQWVRWGGPE
jgi:hypothetical protein